MKTRRHLLTLACLTVTVLLVLIWWASRNQIAKSVTGASDFAQPTSPPNASLPSKTEQEESGEEKSSDGAGGPAVWLPDANGGILVAGGLELTIVLEQPETDPRLAALITEDAGRIYGHLGEHRVWPLKEPRVFSVPGFRELMVSSFLDFRGKGRFFPDAHYEQFGYITEIQGNRALIVPNELKKEYINALERIDSNLDAYLNLFKFRDILENVSDLSARDPASLYYLLGQAERDRDASAVIDIDAFFSGYIGKQFEVGSALFFRDGSAIDPKLEGKLVAQLYMLDDEGNPRGAYPEVIYDNAQWKILIRDNVF